MNYGIAGEYGINYILKMEKLGCADIVTYPIIALQSGRVGTKNLVMLLGSWVLFFITWSSIYSLTLKKLNMMYILIFWKYKLNH